MEHQITHFEKIRHKFNTNIRYLRKNMKSILDNYDSVPLSPSYDKYDICAPQELINAHAYLILLQKIYNELKNAYDNLDDLSNGVIKEWEDEFTYLQEQLTTCEKHYNDINNIIITEKFTY